MNLVTRTAILDAVIDASMIRGALTAPSGARRDFHRWWLELNTALENASSPGITRARRSRLQA